MGSARGDRLSFWPARASSQMPVVAPRLAPKMTAMPPARVIRPVLRKAMVSRHTRVLDCSTDVARVPNSRPLRGVDVLWLRSCSSAPPARAFRPCTRHCMPNRKSARPAHSCSQPELDQNDQPRAAIPISIRRIFEYCFTSLFRLERPEMGRCKSLARKLGGGKSRARRTGSGFDPSAYPARICARSVALVAALGAAQAAHEGGLGGLDHQRLSGFA